MKDDAIGIVLSGQSNMSGRGGLLRKDCTWVWDNDLSNAMAKTYGVDVEDPYIERLNAKMEWEVAKEPLHWDVDTKKTCGIGPGLMMAQMLHEKLQRHIRLVPCAVGQTTIEEWLEPVFFESFMQRCEALSKVDVLIWYQGESDGLNLEQAGELYEKRLFTFLSQCRARLGDETLIIVVRPIGMAEKLPFIDVVRESIDKVVRKSFPDIILVDVDETDPFRVDNIHLNCPTLHSLAKTLCHTIIEQVQKKTDMPV